MALGVSADAFAVSAARGTQVTSARPALVMAAVFGLFQGLMPVVGWLVGARAAEAFGHVDHWIAFGLLAAVGGRMVRAALSDEPSRADGALGVRELLLLGVATSIDALAVGVGLAFLEVSILLAAGVIGLTTFVVALLGAQLGRRSGARFGRWAELVGGLVLIGIGVLVLVDHLLV